MNYFSKSFVLLSRSKASLKSKSSKIHDRDLDGYKGTKYISCLLALFSFIYGSSGKHSSSIYCLEYLRWYESWLMVIGSFRFLKHSTISVLTHSFSCSVFWECSEGVIYLKSLFLLFSSLILPNTCYSSI